MVALAARRSRQIGCADSGASIVKPAHKPRVASERAYVGHDTTVPEERVISHVSCQRGSTGDLTSIVKNNCGPVHAAQCASERAEIDHSAFFPKEGTNCRCSGCVVWRCVGGRNSRYLPALIHTESVRIEAAHARRF